MIRKGRVEESWKEKRKMKGKKDEEKRVEGRLKRRNETGFAKIVI